jgi:hypothetical protein
MCETNRCPGLAEVMKWNAAGFRQCVACYTNKPTSEDYWKNKKDECLKWLNDASFNAYNPGRVDRFIHLWNHGTGSAPLNIMGDEPGDKSCLIGKENWCPLCISQAIYEFKLGDRLYFDCQLTRTTTETKLRNYIQLYVRKMLAEANKIATKVGINTAQSDNYALRERPMIHQGHSAKKTTLAQRARF